VRVARVDPGFAPEHVITFPFEVLRSKHPTDGQVADYYARLVDAVAAVPGVANVGLANRIPLAGGQTNPVRFEGATVAPDELVNVDTRTVTPDYFAAMGIPVLEGRGFDDRDDADAPLVVMVDDRIALTMWPGESPLASASASRLGAARARLSSSAWSHTSAPSRSNVTRYRKSTGTRASGRKTEWRSPSAPCWTRVR
jgi:hypothetical protein